MLEEIFRVGDSRFLGNEFPRQPLGDEVRVRWEEFLRRERVRAAGVARIAAKEITKPPHRGNQCEGDRGKGWMGRSRELSSLRLFIKRRHVGPSAQSGSPVPD